MVPDPRFDLTGDGLVNTIDRDRMVFDLLGTTYGDADLNGAFDSQDFVSTFQAGEYRDQVAGNSTWEEGDWTGDGEFDEYDILLSMVTGGYEQPILPPAGVNATPIIAALEAERSWLAVEPFGRNVVQVASNSLPTAALLAERPLLDEVLSQELTRRDQVFESESTDLTVDDWLTNDLLDELVAGLSAAHDRD